MGRGNTASIGGELTIGTRKARQALADARADMARTVRDMGSMKAPEMQGGTGRFTELNAKATATRNIVQTVYDVLAKPAASNTWYEDLRDGLTAVMGSADAAKDHIGKLRLISDEQSLSDDQFEQIVDYSIRIQSLGYSAEQAAEFIREMANAAEGMGKGVEDLSGMVMSLDKIDESGKAALKSIMGLTKETPALRKVLEEAFGTSNAAELDKLNLSSEQLFEGIKRGMQRLDTARPSTAENTLAIEGRKKQWQGADSEDNNGTLPERQQMDAARAAADRQKMLDSLQEAAAKKAAAQKAKEAAAAEKELQALRATAAAEADLDKARASGDAEAIAAAEDKLDITREAAALAERLKISEEQATEFIRQQNKLKREAAAFVKEQGDAKDRAKEAEALNIETLRANGKNRAAEKAEKAAFLRDEKQRLVEMGYDPADAEKAANQKQQNKEDADYLSRTGRRRIRSAGADNTPAALDRLYTPASRGGQGADPRMRGDTSAIPGFDETTRQRQGSELAAWDAQKRASRAAASPGVDSGVVSRLDLIKEGLDGLGDRFAEALQKAFGGNN